MGITNDIVLRRVERLRQAMRERELHALVIYSAPPTIGYATNTSGNVRYLTNWIASYETLVLVLPLDAEPVLLMSRPQSAIARRMKFQRERGQELTWVRDIRQLAVSPFGERNVVQAVLEERDIPSGRIGIVGGREITADIYLGLTRWELEDADDLLAFQRSVKEPDEIELHRVAAKISDAMMYAGMNAVRANRRLASDIMVEMEHTGRSLGAEQARCWVATGRAPELTIEKLSDLHEPVLDGDRVQSGTFVTFTGYWAHALRVGVKGTPSPEVRRNFGRTVEIQDAGLAQVRAGKPLTDVNRTMAELADEYSPYPRGADPTRMRHGHVLGLDYAEPTVSTAFPQPEAGPLGRSDIIIRPGMVLELHPNFGVPGLGFFSIGDTVLVTESGYEILTRFPREIYEI